MQQEVRQENKMGVMPIGKLVLTMSLPIVISMLGAPVLRGAEAAKVPAPH